LTLGWHPVYTNKPQLRQSSVISLEIFDDWLI